MAGELNKKPWLLNHFFAGITEEVREGMKEKRWGLKDDKVVTRGPESKPQWKPYVNGLNIIHDLARGFSNEKQHKHVQE